MKKSRKRTDEMGRAFAGSQLQVQIYVNRHREELDEAVTNALNLPGDVTLDWRSPLEPKFPEYMDSAFLGALDLGSHASELSRFWPRSGPRWDGLAVLQGRTAERPVGYLLVEGKSYPSEVYGSGCGSRDQKNRILIEQSLASTKKILRPDGKTDWTGRLYQYANRLAHVLFLQGITGLPVWLVNLCFTEDLVHSHSIADWKTALIGIHEELGFVDKAVPNSVEIFLSSRDRSELILPKG